MAEGGGETGSYIMIQHPSGSKVDRRTPDTRRHSWLPPPPLLPPPLADLNNTCTVRAVCPASPHAGLRSGHGACVTQGGAGRGGPD